MTRLWRTYIALWSGSFGEMPRLATFCCRLCLILWHTAVILALMGLVYFWGVFYPWHKLFTGAP